MAGIQSVAMYLVDAFTDGNNEPFTGNPAAVFLLDYDDDIPEDHKQKIATEMNMPITAFISRFGWSQNRKLVDTWAIQWFSVVCEVRLCGHGALAASSIIFNSMLHATPGLDTNPETTIKFETKYGATLHSTITWPTKIITMDFPANIGVSLPREEKWVKDLVSSTLGPQIDAEKAVMDVHVSRTMAKMSIYLHNTGNLRSNEEIIRKIEPNFTKMMAVDSGAENISSVLVSVIGVATNEGPHYLNRVFHPWKGIYEDPVCGAAQTIMGPYWQKQLELEGLHLKKLNVRQLSQRGGLLIVTMEGNTVKLGGATNLVLKGEFLL
jgi:PhzF family phenazine biosynthesis protein